MKELQRWLDMAPTLRRAKVIYASSNVWSVCVWTEAYAGGKNPTGSGSGDSLTFAVVAAILDFRKNQEG